MSIIAEKVNASSEVAALPIGATEAQPMSSGMTPVMCVALVALGVACVVAGGASPAWSLVPRWKRRPTTSPSYVVVVRAAPCAPPRVRPN
jgi:hypothetical protein